MKESDAHACCMLVGFASDGTEIMSRGCPHARFPPHVHRPRASRPAPLATHPGYPQHTLSPPVCSSPPDTTTPHSVPPETTCTPSHCTSPHATRLGRLVGWARAGVRYVLNAVHIRLTGDSPSVISHSLHGSVCSSTAIDTVLGREHVR